jgi:hypothetical protein
MSFQSLAAVRTSDARSDDRTREIAFRGRSVLISRRVAGIAMRVEVPLASYRGVTLSLGAELEAGAVHTIELLHRDPDLSILLKQTTDSDEIAVEWSAWADALSLPQLFEQAPAAGEPSDPAAPILPMPRRRGSAVARRRPRFSRRRKIGAQQRLAVTYREEREIVSYE